MNGPTLKFPFLGLVFCCLATIAVTVTPFPKWHPDTAPGIQATADAGEPDARGAYEHQSGATCLWTGFSQSARIEMTFEENTGKIHVPDRPAAGGAGPFTWRVEGADGVVTTSTRHGVDEVAESLCGYLAALHGSGHRTAARNRSERFTHLLDSLAETPSAQEGNP